jgi:GAF domain-containing protein
MENGAKREIYRRLRRELAEILPDTGDPVAAMSTSACLIHHALPYASWTGFYRVVAPRLLRLGPFQGPPGCLEIPFERGVCGAAARTREVQLVVDVHAFPGHIACDEAARSEIVVPILDHDSVLVAVLDVDSHLPAAFDEVDREELLEVAEMLRPHLTARDHASRIRGSSQA